MIQKVCVQPSSGFPAATGKKMAEGSDAGPGVGPSTGASAADPIAAGSHDKENWPVGGVRTCSRRRSPLPSWYQRTPLRDVSAIVRVTLSLPPYVLAPRNDAIFPQKHLKPTYS